MITIVGPRGDRSSGEPTDAPGSRGRPPRRGVVFCLAVVALSALVAGVADAAWSSNGTGPSQARAGSAAPPVVTGAAVSSGLLYPGAVGDVAVSVTNPNPYPVRVLQVVGAGPASGAGGIGTCASTGVTLAAQAPNVLVVAGGSTTLVLTGAAAMSNASDNGCQSATFTIPVTVTVASAA